MIFNIILAFYFVGCFIWAIYSYKNQCGCHSLSFVGIFMIKIFSPILFIIFLIYDKIDSIREKRDSPSLIKEKTVEVNKK